MKPVSRPAPDRRHPGFSLVLSLTVMAMLLMLCIGAAALLAVELRVASASVSLARARLNALAGARIALGELQRLAGPDQSVTANATLLCNDAETDPTSSAYYTNAVSGTVVHPRWVGIWNAGRDSGAPSAVADAATGETTKAIRRTNAGYLMDSRFANGADWSETRAAASPSKRTRRLLGWLVSGNEGLPGDSAALLTPFSPVADSRSGDALGRGGDVVMLGAGTFGLSSGAALPVPETRKDGDWLGARAAKVAMGDAAGTDSGAFAYWVDDEGLKARINLANKYAALSPDPSNIAAGGYFNLRTPQRPLFDAVSPSYAQTGSKPFSGYSRLDADRFSAVTDFSSLALASGGASAMTPDDLRSLFFHDITFVSAGVLSDTVSGGLMRDLTPYLESGPIPAYAGMSGSGLTDGLRIIGGPPPAGSDPDHLPGMDRLNALSPKLGLLRNWYAGGSDGVSLASEVVSAVAPATRALPGAGSTFTIGDSGQQMSVPSFGFPDFSNPTNAAPRMPVLCSTAYNYRLTYTTSGTTYAACYLIWPAVTVWNPYAVPLKIANLRVTHYNGMSTNGNVNGGASIYHVQRPVLSYSPGDVTLDPGQAVTYVPAPGQDFSTTGSNTPMNQPVTVAMQPGNPSVATYYKDPGWNTSHSAGIGSGALNKSVPYYWILNNISPNNAYTTTPAFNQYFLQSGDTTLQEVNLDPYGKLQGNGYNVCQFSLPAASDTLLPIEQVQAEDPTSGNLKRIFHGFRTQWLDNDSTLSDGPRNLNANPFLGGNFRATVHSRHPFDRATLARNISYAGTGMFTSDNARVFDDPSRFASDPKSSVPFFGEWPSGRSARFALVDVPRKSLGVLSLGEFQHAPLTQVCWAPGLAFGNALLPQDDAPTDRTGYTADEEAARWNLLATGVFKTTDALTQKDKLGDQATFTDWSYELNAGLWDHYFVSGIPAANTGWTQRSWNLGNDVSAARDSRYVQTVFPETTGYFADANFKAYRAAYTLLRQGNFNVNSTGVVAWEALLSSFRNIRVPSRSGTASSTDTTPYSRLLYPAAGAVASAADPYATETWAGYRTLTDDEIRTLAGKIVVEVKRRGPFLGLSDFVNRRLKPAGGSAPSSAPYAGWTEKESAFLGTLQAAIDNAGINAALTPASGDLAMNRSVETGDGITGDTNDTSFPSKRENPSKKPRSKIAGAPGYLTQADVLQQLAPALAARSDTFTIRARGYSPDGACAVVELVVQRTPVPLVAAAGSGGLPINPKAVVANTDMAGRQTFGRRFVVAALRWKNPSEL